MKKKIVYLILLAAVTLSACTGKKEEGEEIPTLSPLETVQPTESGMQPEGQGSTLETVESVVIGELPEAKSLDELIEPYYNETVSDDGTSGQENETDAIASVENASGDGFTEQSLDVEPEQPSSVSMETEAPSWTEADTGTGQEENIPEEDGTEASDGEGIPIEYESDEYVEYIEGTDLDMIPDEALDGIQSIYESQAESMLADEGIMEQLRENARKMQ